MTQWPPAARPTNPQTSHEGEAQFTATGKRLSIADRVERSLRAFPGRTYGEIAEQTSLLPHQVWRRLSDLKNLGRIHQDGSRVFNGYRQGLWWPTAIGQLPLKQ